MIGVGEVSLGGREERWAGALDRSVAIICQLFTDCLLAEQETMLFHRYQIGLLLGLLAVVSL